MPRATAATAAAGAPFRQPRGILSTPYRPPDASNALIVEYESLKGDTNREGAPNSHRRAENRPPPLVCPHLRPGVSLPGALQRLSLLAGLVRQACSAAALICCEAGNLGVCEGMKHARTVPSVLLCARGLLSAGNHRPRHPSLDAWLECDPLWLGCASSFGWVIYQQPWRRGVRRLDAKLRPSSVAQPPASRFSSRIPLLLLHVPPAAPGSRCLDGDFLYRNRSDRSFDAVRSAERSGVRRRYQV